ncbi:MAG: methylmalonyl Co-A mutase-associated GTPase MeaB [Bacteroidales bacterium]|nr:methylmalonyl Co-A mutase-associated GTPase MeaB [Bacteroidales bacterium]
MNQDKHHKSALKVNAGIEKPVSINPQFAAQKKKTKSLQPVSYYVQGILKGDRTILSMAITLIESTLSSHRDMAQEIIEACLPHSGKSIRIGITGVPGVGKSTFIEALGIHITQKLGQELAVLAIDPSSQRTKGSILGDKTRMEKLTMDDKAFIRPSPSSGSLGGVTQKTRESIILCEAAGFEVILIETVGVGQSETAVHSMVDFFLLLMLAGAGDELQGIKRGIMEMADAILINKADGDNKNRAELARREYANALHLFPPTESGWIPKTQTCSAYTGDGIADIWSIIADYRKEMTAIHYFEQKRKEQNIHLLQASIEYSLQQNFYENKDIKTLMQQIKEQVLKQEISSYKAADKLLETYYKNI